jgi:hypothetical protein
MRLEEKPYNLRKALRQRLTSQASSLMPERVPAAPQRRIMGKNIKIKNFKISA